MVGHSDRTAVGSDVGHPAPVCAGTKRNPVFPFRSSGSLPVPDRSDERNSVEIPNTGGEWLEIVPAVQYHVMERLALKASAKFPLSRDLNDELQFTTKFAFRLSLSYVFGGTQTND